MSELKLTKKQKKAQAFRTTKGKKKGEAEQQDVPEMDLDENDGADVVEEKQKKSKKRKIEDVGSEDGEKGDAEKKEGGGDGEPELKKKKRQRGKKGGGQKAEGANSRLILFLGNLPFKVTTEQIEEHFKDCGEKPTIRLLTPKPKSSDSTTSRTKGCAFLQFTLATALQSALRLHHSEMSGRKINVELSAGGGGNSESRKAKIDENRKRLDLEREKAAKNKKGAEGEPETEDKSLRWKKAAEEKKKADEEAAAKEAAESGKPVKKVRDRRIPKVNQMGEQKERKRAQEARERGRPSGGNMIPLGKGF